MNENKHNSSKENTYISSAYRRALWIVIILNTSFGIAEVIGGFIANSQALKADALDFIGDGTITFLALLAISWSHKWRARSSLLQGVFVGLIGLAVLISTVYRVLILNIPEAEIMGIFGFIALLINIIAAIVLFPHRQGDSHVRAVWLFSRNDALGNIVVVIAAALVYWSNTAWPDLVAAAIIAFIFLQSSWSIIRDARKDLKSEK